MEIGNHAREFVPNLGDDKTLLISFNSIVRFLDGMSYILITVLCFISVKTWGVPSEGYLMSYWIYWIHNLNWKTSGRKWNRKNTYEIHQKKSSTNKRLMKLYDSCFEMGSMNLPKKKCWLLNVWILDIEVIFQFLWFDSIKKKLNFRNHSYPRKIL